MPRLEYLSRRQQQEIQRLPEIRSLLKTLERSPKLEKAVDEWFNKAEWSVNIKDTLENDDALSTPILAKIFGQSGWERLSQKAVDQTEAMLQEWGTHDEAREALEMDVINHWLGEYILEHLGYDQEFIDSQKYELYEGDENPHSYGWQQNEYNRNRAASRVASIHLALQRTAGRIPANEVRQILRLPSLRRLYSTIRRDPQAEKTVMETAEIWGKVYSEDYFEQNLEQGEPCPDPEHTAEQVDPDVVFGEDEDDYGIQLYLTRVHPPRKVILAYLEWANEARALSPTLDKLTSRHPARAYEQWDELNDLINDTVQKINIDAHWDQATAAIGMEWEKDWDDLCLQAADAAEERRDPYAYRGVSRHDF